MNRFGDIASLSNGSGLTVAERSQIATNNTNATGSVTIHSDLSNAGSGAIITVVERNQIATNTTNATGSVTIHSDLSSAGSGSIITVAERNQIATNNTNATGSVTIHSDLSSAGSGAIITVAERTQIATNTTNIGTNTTAIATKADLAHTHTSSEITDFGSSVDTLITAQKGTVNGIPTLDGNSKIPTSQLPAIAFTDVTVVVDIAARDLLTPNEGDVSKVTGTNTTYIYDGSAWIELSVDESVTSVNGNIGAVNLTTTEITEGTNQYYTEARVTANSTVANHTAHVADSTLHRVINDAGVANDELYSAEKISQDFTSARDHLDLLVVGSDPVYSGTSAPDYDLVEAFTNYTLGNYTVVASSEEAGGFNAWKAFDGDYAGRWVSAQGTYNAGGDTATSADSFDEVNGSWIKVSCDQKRAIGSVQLEVSPIGGTAWRPITWRILTSDDDTVWTVAYTETVDRFNAETTPVITFPSAIEGRYFVLQVLTTTTIYASLTRLTYGAPTQPPPTGIIGYDTKTVTGDLTVEGNLTANKITHEIGWKDLIQSFAASKVNGTSPPTWKEMGTSGLSAYQFDPTEEVFVFFHITHSYALGTDAYPHVHFLCADVQTAGNTVTWRFAYNIAKGHSQGQSLTGTPTNIDFTYTYTGTEIAGEHIVAECSDIQAFDLLEPDTIIYAKVSLLSATATGDIFGLCSDLHYQSITETTLNKTPAFN